MLSSARVTDELASVSSLKESGVHGKHGLAYAGLFMFTLILYARPQELFPGVFGDFPLAKLVAIATIAVYVLSKLSAGEKLTFWPLQLKMVLLIAALGIVFIPVAQTPQDTITVLSDIYSKVVCVFILFVNLVDTRERVTRLMKLMVLCGTWIAYDAIGRYRAGELTLENRRIQGVVGGMFGGPNDLAISFDLLLPLAVFLMLQSKGVMRLLYLGCTAVLAVGVVVTFSRGGFLGLVFSGAVMLWKLGRQYRIWTVVASATAVVILLVAMPSGYGSRISSISNEAKDATGSSWERQELLKRAFNVALHHPLIGIGMGNFHSFSINEKVAHNSYLEIWAELGLLGLAAYLTLISSSYSRAREIEKESLKQRESTAADATNNYHYFGSVALQGAIVAFIVCAFFGSIQYLWYIYYLAGFAVALRRIWEAESRVIEAEQDTRLASREVCPMEGRRGVLWKSYWLPSAYR